MTHAQNGNTVTVNYTGRLEDGSVFDTTENGQPLQFVLGQAGLIQGFEQAVLGMSPGEAKTVKLVPEEAYGPRREEMVVTISRDGLPPDLNPQVGQRLELKRQDHSTLGATVTQVAESSVTVDANHPLAGEALTFEISVLKVA